MTNESSDLVLSAHERAKLADLLGRLGEVGTSELLRLSRTSVLRLAMGLPSRRGTIVLARIGLGAS
jgi:hypothetical protein